jgi:hypothetical protein
MEETPRGEGYDLRVERGKVQVNLVKRFLDDALRVETERSLAPDQWHHLAVTYDGSRVASGVRIYVDGKEEKVKVLLDDLNQSFKTKEPLRIGSGGGPDSRFRGAVAEVRVYKEVLTPEEVEWLATADAINEIAALPAE